MTEMNGTVTEAGDTRGEGLAARDAADPQTRDRAVRDVKVAIIGAGFAGLCTAIKLKDEKIEDFVVLERASDLGGTWRDNTYPGCACDVPSHLYSFSFAPNPNWSHIFARQAEIQRYLKDCAGRFRVIQKIRFEHEVQAVAWDDA